MEKFFLMIGQWIAGAYCVTVAIADIWYSWLFIKQSLVHFLLYFVYGWIVCTFKAIFWPIAEFLL